MTEEGIPCLYYGTEQDFAGGNDPANREVLWNSGFATNGRHLPSLREARAHARSSRTPCAMAIRTSFAPRDHTGDEEDAGIFAFERAGGDAGARTRSS